jgi:hypothetical protein
MESLLPLVVLISLAAVLRLIISSSTKIIIVRMAITEVSSEHRAEVLKAASLLFSKRGAKGRRRSQLD